MHAVVIGSPRVLFAIGAWLGGPTLFREWAQGETFQAPSLYRTCSSCGGPRLDRNLLAAVLRGAGNVRVPAIVTATGRWSAECCRRCSSSAGLGSSHGRAGAGVALILFNVGSAVVLVLYMRSAHSAIRLARNRLQWRLSTTS